MPLQNYMIAHKEKKYFHPQKHIAHSIKISRGFLFWCNASINCTCHYAVFHIAGNMHGGRNSSAGENDTPVMKRNICQRNIITQPFIQAADQRKHQRPASLTFVRGIHRCSPHKGPVTRKMFPFDDIMMDVYLSHGCQAATPHTDFL